MNPELTAELKKLVLRVEDDLRARLSEEPTVDAQWRDEHRGALKAGRTAGAWETYRDDRITQVAVSWVLTTAFVRFCEDNGLLGPVWIAGPKARRQEALDAELAYFRKYPTETSREWLMQSIRHLEKVPATAGLVDPYAPLRQLRISGDMATEILRFWRTADENGELRFDFADPDLSTRFLGDLYQDLSEHAKKTYALLQTPVFVEEFILDRTLTPALEERPLEGFRLIDPTCGSGHFLLGAFDRFLAAWEAESPEMPIEERVRRALGSVHGVDINPFAVAIARFRLIVAALKTLGLESLENAPDFALNLAAGDSLLPWNEPTLQVAGEDEHLFSTSMEDEQKLYELLRPGTYDVVVGNPPYITVKDKALNQQYRALYPTCKGTYALTVPFMERFFQLARSAADGNQVSSPGWVGQITSNSFMKREFGSRLIEEFLAHKDLRLVVDTSGAYIPGHGTPTVVIVGRNVEPSSSTVRAVLGVRGEPGQPSDPALGVVWREILESYDADLSGMFVTGQALPRKLLGEHPWSLSGGGATDVMMLLESKPDCLQKHISGAIGFASFPGADDAFIGNSPELYREIKNRDLVRPIVLGESVRDWNVAVANHAFVPYDSDSELLPLSKESAWYRRLWPLRTNLGSITGFGGVTKAQAGEPWWGWYRWVRARYATPLAITFAFVATHNHFVLDRGGKVFKQSAPVIKLPATATEDDHLALLGVLNSSTACFWLKQNSHNKGRPGAESAGADEPWEHRFEFTGTTLNNFPLPDELPLQLARSLDQLASEAAGTLAEAMEPVPTSTSLAAARLAYDEARGRMIALQEESDWETYALYHLLAEAPVCQAPPAIRPEERAFAIVLARRVASGEETTTWFSHWNHQYRPITEIPQHWPDEYKAVVQARIDLIESDKFIGLLERSEYKRRWATEQWEKQQDRALRRWILDRLEDPAYWFNRDHRPVPRSVAQLSDQVSKDPELVSVIQLWERRPDVPVSDSLARLMVDEAVPYLAAYRLKESGMRKFAAWQETWDLQRRDDAGETVDEIPVPPKYTNADFRKANWWQARGKLDVPKERFILYPDANRAGDNSALLGWAGWDHLQQALALGVLYTARQAEGVEVEILTPLVAGLAELQPWVQQWHNDVDPEFGVNMAEYTAELLRSSAQEIGRTPTQLAEWRPTGRTRGRRNAT